ncbi:fimbrial protein [Rhodanobacter terrae]|uniref:Fimbrial protein n=1 Tax=Rhodanobacter terrae TaxID=418647 RepID=A0ABW0SVU0_9GAMM
MNKTLLSAALIAGFGIAAFAPQTARADGTITFTGKVVANTCSFNVNSSGSANGTVALPVAFTSALAASGAVTGKTPFTIVVSGCDSKLTSVQELFSGSNLMADGNLQNTAATNNVEVQLLNGTTNSPINLNTGANSPVGTLSGGGVTLNYAAQYYATGVSTSGLVNTSVTYTTSYL